MSHLWKELHERALTYVGGDDMYFLRNFAKKIPALTGCPCAEFWKQIVKAHPPRFGNNGEYFEWTVFCHNEVNKKLNKPVITVEEAKRLTLQGMNKK
jgi:hypothetical protein